MTAPPRSAGLSSRAPCRPLSSRTVNSSVIGGCGSLCLISVSASTTSSATPVRASPPSAVVPSETMRSPSRRGLAPAQSGTVSRWVENSSRGPGRVPGRSTIRLPVSVGSGMRLLASSKRMAEAGTPTVFSASLTAAAIAASWPVTPSTERNRIRCSSAAATSRGIEVLLMMSIQCSWSRLASGWRSAVTAPTAARAFARPRRAPSTARTSTRHRGASARRSCRRPRSCRISGRSRRRARNRR